MNKSALKSFATEARLELLEKIQLQARKLGITPDAIQQATLESSDAIFIDGKQLLDVERKQRNKLIARINEIGYDRVMEEAAYTWFNRFIALRYMEVNDYLPTKVRVLSSVNPDSTEPDMMKETLNLDLPLDKELVYNLKIQNKTDELFKYLIKVHCNDLNRYMPFMFETIDGYMEVLFPEGLLGTDTFVRKMTDVENIPEEDWTKVEIVGWLYQYYISEENARVIQAKKKYKKEEIPFATQLFTPEWIVRYMVQNALGRYWVESHPKHRDLIENWEFYLENPNPEPDFEEKLAPYINKELNVEDIKCFDPAMGSGHILAYMFDVLYEIYSKCGYMEREIPRLIIEKNLYGLDIDDRAYQLASFSVVMKAMQYNRRFFRSIEREGLKLNLASIHETHNLKDENIELLAGVPSGDSYEKVKAFIQQFKNAKEIGSLIQLEEYDIDYIQKRLKIIEQQPSDLFDLELKESLIPLMQKLIIQAEFLSQTYDIVVTNPPYAANKYLGVEISNYLKVNYADAKSDLFSAFIIMCLKKTKNEGLISLVTPLVWMFISSYEDLRNKIINEASINSLIQLEYNSFPGATVPVCTFTLRNYPLDSSGEYIKLSDFPGIEKQPQKVLEAISNPMVEYRYKNTTSNYKLIKGMPVIYWAADNTFKALINDTKIADFGLLSEGLKTRENERFLRLWFEVDYTDKNGWKPYSKGGGFKKWYGNNEYFIKWKNEGQEIKDFKKSSGTNFKFYFKETLTWSAISSYKFSVRYINNSIFGGGGSGIVNIPEDRIYHLLALLNTNIVNEFLNMLSATLNFEVGTISEIPVIFDNIDLGKIETLSREAVSISKEDWDSSEKSWDYEMHPLLKYRDSSGLIENANDILNKYKESRFNRLKAIEEEINHEFLKSYNLESEYTASVEEADITISRANSINNVKMFISYAIGCILGRYSLDEPGLIFAGGDFNENRYVTMKADKDNILPILQGNYIEDNITDKIIEFVKITFGEKKLVENCNFISGQLGKKEGESIKDVLNRYLLTEYFEDHISIYSSRGRKSPIYWMLTSGKEKAFNCLIYMHRYDKTTLSRIRTNYVHEVQNRMDAERTDLLNVINGDSTVKEIAAAKKALKSLEKKIDELKKYDELLHHMADQQIEIDLDDGVKHNYELFKGLVAPIK